MNSGIKTVFLISGYLLIILSCVMIIPYVVEQFMGDGSHVFAICSVLTAFIGILLIITNQTKNKKLNIQHAFLMTTLAWLFISLFGSLPFMFSTLNLNFTDAYFETMSGITTTGSTILIDVERSSKGILIWRALLQWLGGIGIIVMAITILPLLNVGGMQVFRAESSDNSEKILPRSREIALAIFKIYFVLTIACASFYFLFGMSVFDSIAHSMTTIATGGFSTYTNSFGHFDSFEIELVAIIFIIMGSIPFLSYIKFIKGDRLIFFSDKQIQGFLFFLILSILTILIYSMLYLKSDLVTAIRTTLFNVTSIISGTGYTTNNYSGWGNFAVFYFLLLMLVGGCAGSTTCGIKIFRFQIIGQFIKKQIKNIFYPHGVFPVKYNKQAIDEKFLSSVLTFVCLYIGLFLLLSLLLSLTGLDLITSISGAATSLSNVGPGLGDTIGPSENFAYISNVAKWFLIVGMLLGRLELFTVLILFLPSFWKN
ncbi:MAG: potassium transporter TrkH [Candidatus Pelagibacter sp.]|nr:potassium transporter TrkH [Candidatus Pelagibacter sp.]|tara:strand:+ start:1076 stop:2524 length:1449 start_codon:yes stop_codon:yes gene_type:complete